MEYVTHETAAKKAIDFDPAAAMMEEKVVDHRRLNRNRPLVQKLNFRVVGPEDLTKVHKMLYASFHPDEPIIKHLGLCKGLYSIPDADRMVDEIVSKNLSVIAEDSSGKPMALCVNNSCFASELTPDRLKEELAMVKDEGFKKYMSIHHQLRLQNKHVYEEIGTNNFFSLRMVTVSDCARGQGLATDVIRRSVLLAGSLGFHGIKTEATGRWSKSAFGKIGLLTSSSIQYKEFEYQGERVLAGMADECEISYLRKKFFQSALKHIL